MRVLPTCNILEEEEVKKLEPGQVMTEVPSLGAT